MLGFFFFFFVFFFCIFLDKFLERILAYFKKNHSFLHPMGAWDVASTSPVLGTKITSYS